VKQRTTVYLDGHSRAALQDLERFYGCSASEAVRRALVAHRDALVAVPQDKCRRPTDALAGPVRPVDGKGRALLSSEPELVGESPDLVKVGPERRLDATRIVTVKRGLNRL